MTLDGLDVLWAANDWLAEGRWQRRPLRALLPDLNRSAHGGDPRGRFGRTSRGPGLRAGTCRWGPWSAGVAGRCWLWQIEHHGGWHWQVGEHAAGLLPGLLGPTDTEHHWDTRWPRARRSPRCRWPSPSATTGSTGAVAALTAYRRAVRRPHHGPRRLPVIFNDYMNTLMGDPTTERLLPLIDAAAAAGAEYFCIDAGWYAETGEPGGTRSGRGSRRRNRFPGGIAEVLDQSGRRHGARASGWSPRSSGCAARWPGACPTRRSSCGAGGGWSSTAAITWTCATPPRSSTSTRWSTAWSASSASATSSWTTTSTRAPAPTPAALSAGAGLLGHNRAHLDWLDARAGPPSRPGHRELRLRRGADGLRPALPAAAAVDQRPAGLPALRRRSPRRLPPP